MPQKSLISRLEHKARLWVNPYVNRIREFPGKILIFEDVESDSAFVRELAATSAKVLVEVGSGSGRHLIELAKRAPEAVAIGFELRFKRCVRTVEKAKANGVEKLCVLQTDGRALAEIFLPASVDAIYVNFPEPWDKRKRRKNRVLGEEFLRGVEQVLKPGGLLSMKTDRQDHFREFLTVAKRASGFTLEAETEDLHASEYAEENIWTEFEQLFRAQKQPICMGRFRKRL